MQAGSPLRAVHPQGSPGGTDEKRSAILSFSISDNTAVQYSHMRQPYKTQKKGSVCEGEKQRAFLYNSILVATLICAIISNNP